MCRLIKAEFFKLVKSIYFKALLIGTILYALMDIYAYFTGLYHPSNGVKELFHSFMFWQRCLLLCGILAGVFVGGDFDNRILHSQIAVGNSRRNIFLAKAFAYWIACIFVTMVYQSVDIIGMTCLFGFGPKITFYEFMLLARIETVYLMIFSGFVSICILTAFVFKALFAVTAAEIVWIMFSSAIFQNLSNINTLANHLYTNSIFGSMTALTLPLYVSEDDIRSLESVPTEEIFQILSVQHYTKFVLISIITVLVTTTLSYSIFKKTELK